MYKYQGAQAHSFATVTGWFLNKHYSLIDVWGQNGQGDWTLSTCVKLLPRQWVLSFYFVAWCPLSSEVPSVFQTEVHTIDICTSINLDRRYKAKNIAIMSYSQTYTQALSSSVVRSRMVLEYRVRLNLLERGNSMSLPWVPRHIGVEVNEKAHALLLWGGPEPFYGLGDAFLK